MAAKLRPRVMLPRPFRATSFARLKPAVVSFSGLLGGTRDATLRRVLLDTMILSYLAEAMAGDYDPRLDADDALRDERVAAFRLFLWASVGVGETAVEQATRTRDAAWRSQLDRLVMIHLPEYRVPDADMPHVDSRTIELNQIHGDAEDCRIVAEAEALGVGLATFDFEMQKKLAAHAEVPLRGAGEYWRELAVPRGTRPHLEPAWDNPIGATTWWRWD